MLSNFKFFINDNYIVNENSYRYYRDIGMLSFTNRPRFMVYIFEKTEWYILNAHIITSISYQKRILLTQAVLNRIFHNKNNDYDDEYITDMIISIDRSIRKSEIFDDDFLNDSTIDHELELVIKTSIEHDWNETV